MTQMRLILGSGSPQRNKLLAASGMSFEVVAPDDSAECGICSTGGPAGLVVDLALRKAANVAEKVAAADGSQRTPSLVLACDTVAECGGEVLGKPRDEQHAKSMLERLSGTTHRVYSGLCLWPVNVQESPRPLETQVAVTELRMDALDAQELDEYLATGLWRGKAGAFGLQDRPGWLHIESGSESNVIGLPMEMLGDMLGPWKPYLKVR